MLESVADLLAKTFQWTEAQILKLKPGKTETQWPGDLSSNGKSE
jgi:hypothetical protein